MQKSKTIIIIGAGIVGVSTALSLQRMGRHVIILDREGPASGTSYGNAGILASIAVVPVPTPGLLSKAPKMLLSKDQPLFMKWRYLPKLLPWLIPFLKRANAHDARETAQSTTMIIGDSVADHQALAKGTKAERFIVPSDYLFAYRDKAEFDAEAFGWGLRRDNGFEWEEISGPAVQAYDPLYGPDIGFLVRCPHHGRITDPGGYVQALAEEFTDKGGEIRMGSLEDIELKEGAITAIKTQTETLPCDTLIVTAGIWSKKIMSLLGLSIPMESERGYHMELWSPNIMPERATMISAGKFVVTPMEGRIRLAGIVELGGTELGPSEAPFALLERAFRKAMPNITWERTTTWMGHRPSTTDSLPIIGPLPHHKGIFAGFGHQHLGLTGGPKTGRLLAQMVTGQKPNMDMTPFDPSRYIR